MKNKFLLFFLFVFSLSFAQKFEVVLLIDNTYNKTNLNLKLETMNVLSLIEEDYLTIKMIAAAETESKIKHDNGEEGKDRKDCDIILMAGVRCDPCRRLGLEQKSTGTIKVYAQTTDNDFGTCDLKVENYEAISATEDLGEIIKEQKKIAKKSKSDCKVIFWIPSNETIFIDLVAFPSDKKVDFGTEVTFTAKTNSKENTSVIMRVNDELIDECSETGSVKISRASTLVKTIEIVEPTIVTLEGKGCGNPERIEIELNGKCDEVEKVQHDILYDSKSVGPLGKKKSTLDGVPFTEIKLVDNKLYMVVLNKQCGIRSYRAELVDVQTGVEYKLNLKKDANQSAIHLTTSDRDNYSVFTLNHNDMKSRGIFDDRIDKSDPKYKMRIFPVEAIKDDLDIKGNESMWEVVKFQKCN
jgi:hypothetical protein